MSLQHWQQGIRKRAQLMAKYGIVNRPAQLSFIDHLRTVQALFNSQRKVFTIGNHR